MNDIFLDRDLAGPRQNNKRSFHSSFNIFHILMGIFGIIWSTSAYSQHPQVEILDGGNCWLKKNQTQIEGVQLASFPEGKAYHFTEIALQNLEEDLSLQVRQISSDAFSPGHYEMFFFCNFEGVKFYINYQDAEKGLCFHGGIKGDGQGQNFELTQVYPNHQNKKGPCFGQQPGSLLLDMKGAQGKGPADMCLKELEASGVLILERLAEDVVKVQTSEKFHFQENKIKQMILESPHCQEFLQEKDVEYSNLYGPTGSFSHVKSGSLKF